MSEQWITLRYAAEILADGRETLMLSELRGFAGPTGESRSVRTTALAGPHARHPARQAADARRGHHAKQCGASRRGRSRGAAVRPVTTLGTVRDSGWITLKYAAEIVGHHRPYLHLRELPGLPHRKAGAGLPGRAPHLVRLQDIERVRDIRSAVGCSVIWAARFVAAEIGGADMRAWETDGSIDADSRYPHWLKWAFRQRWIPDFALRWVWRFAPRCRG